MKRKIILDQKISFKKLSFAIASIFSTTIQIPARTKTIKKIFNLVKRIIQVGVEFPTVQNVPSNIWRHFLHQSN